MNAMLRAHVRDRKTRTELKKDPELKNLQYYSTGLLSNYDAYNNKIDIASRLKLDKKKRDRSSLLGTKPRTIVKNCIESSSKL